MAEHKYVRLAPYDKRRGRLCMRYCVGGKVFEQETWYKVPAAWADELAKLEQESTGAPVFEVYSEKEYRDQVFQEQSVIAQQVQAQANQAQPATAKTVDEGPKKSQWEGLQASEVSDAEQRRDAAQQAQAAASGGSSDKGDAKLDSMTKSELLSLAKDRGLSVGDDWGAKRLRSAIREASAGQG